MAYLQFVETGGCFYQVGQFVLSGTINIVSGKTVSCNVLLLFTDISTSQYFKLYFFFLPERDLEKTFRTKKNLIGNFETSPH